MHFVVAAFFLAMGLACLARPSLIPQMFPAGTPQGRSEIRAVYGGFGVAVAILLALRPDPGVRLALAVALLGMAAGRIVSAALDRRFPLWPAAAFTLVELALAGLVLW